MTSTDQKIGEAIGWQRAISWGVGLALTLSIFFAGITYGGLREDISGVRKDLKGMGTVIVSHGERLATNATRIENHRDQICLIRDGLTQHLIEADH